MFVLLVCGCVCIGILILVKIYDSQIIWLDKVEKLALKRVDERMVHIVKMRHKQIQDSKRY